MATHTFPQSFTDRLKVDVSTVHDGTMLDRSRLAGDQSIIENRKRWVHSHGYDYENTVCQLIAYHELATYDRISTVDVRMTQRASKGVVADALITDRPGVSLFLPVADCVATVLYDATRNVVALLHMGRHSTMTHLIEKTVLTMRTSFGCDARDISAWLSPSAQKQSYRMDYFTQKDDPRWEPYVNQKDDGIYLDMQGRIQQDIIDCGVPSEHIVASGIDTVTSPDYFSHSAGDTNGRFVVMVTMRPDKQP